MTIFSSVPIDCGPSENEWNQATLPSRKAGDYSCRSAAPHKHLSTGAKCGIGIGAAIFAIILLKLGHWYNVRQSRGERKLLLGLGL